MPTVAEALALALQHHRAGHLAQAEQICSQVLQAEPGNAEAWHLLGVLAHQTGRHDLAAAYISQALALGPGSAVRHSNLGAAYQALGRPQDAEGCFRAALRLRPAFPEAWNMLGYALQAQGRPREAEACFREGVRLRPDYAEARYNLANALSAEGRLEEAVACYEEALRLRPDLPEAHTNLGNALQTLGRLPEAEACFREALRLRPDFPAAHNNLGNALQAQGRSQEAEACLREALRLHRADANAHNSLGVVLQKQGRLPEAEACFREALRLRPDFAGARSNLGNALQAQGRSEEAEACFRQALLLQPNDPEAHHSLGTALQRPGRLDEAVACYREALRLRPEYPEAHHNLGIALANQGDMPGAEAHLREALRLRPRARLRLALATLLPPVYQSAADVRSWRQRLTDHLGRLLQEGLRIDLTDETVQPLFYLAYQGYNERDTQGQIACLHAPPPRPTPPPKGRAAGRKIRVGFISAYFWEHTVGRLMQGLIARLARDTFEVTVLAVGRHCDETAAFIRRHADRHLELPSNLPAARRAVAEQDLDVLFYADIGMEPVTYSLAFSRLAPVQCATWGHSLTTGIPAVDYYVSSGLFEPDDAQQYYTEQLILLRGLGTYYYRPVLPPRPKGRADFGLGEEEHVYACPQSLFKLHPDFDEMLAGVLRADPRGVLVLLRGHEPAWEALLRQRWATTMPDVLGRVRWLPRQDPQGFLALSAASDVLLDPYPFGGCNTSLEGLALGTPIVTLPAPFLRGRFTLGMYRKMGVPDCVVSSPQEYVATAVRLGTDRDYREAVRAKIRAASGVLYEDTEAVQELEQFLLQVAATTPHKGA